MDLSDFTEKELFTELFDEDTTWKLMATAAATAASFAAHAVLKESWKLITKEDPPLNPADSETAWEEALIWTVASGVLVGLCRLAARRGTVAVLRSLK